MLFIKYWYKNLLSFKSLLITILLMAILISTYWGIHEGINVSYKNIAGENVYSVYEGNMACPISSLVPEEYVKIIENIDGVNVVSPEIRQRTTIAEDFSATICGVDPDKFILLKQLIIEDKKWDNFRKNPTGLIIGKTLAQNIKKKFGTLNIDFRFPLEIEGVFDLPFSLLNNMMIVHKDHLKKIVFKGENITVINIKFDQTVDSNKMIEIIENKLNDDTNQSKLICRPETQVWERTQAAIAQVGDYVLWHIVIGLLIFFFLYFIFSFTYLRKNKDKEALFITRKNINKIAIFRLLYLLFNLLTGITLGCFIAYFIFISHPTMGGADIFHPHVFVNSNVLVKIVMSFFVIGAVSSILGIYFWQYTDKKNISNKVLTVLISATLVVMIVIVNIMMNVPIRMRLGQLNAGEKENIILLQKSSVGHAFSNIPFLVNDICQLSPDVKTLDNKKLISSVIHVAGIINNNFVIILGVNTDTFFEIAGRLNIVEGRMPKNKFEIAVGKNVFARIKRKLKINDYLEYEGIKWQIVGVIDAGCSVENSFIYANIEDIIKATDRETLQYITLEINDIGNIDRLRSKVQKYYNIQLSELPDLPEIELFIEKKYVKKMARAFIGLFALNGIIVFASLAAGFILIRSFAKLSLIKQKASTLKILIITGITGIICETLIFLVGRYFYLTFAMAAISYQPPLPLIIISFCVTMLICFAATLKINRNEHMEAKK